jgi:hypothetical protein
MDEKENCSREGLNYALGVLFVISIFFTILQIAVMQVIGIQFLTNNPSFSYLIIGLYVIEVLMAGYLNLRFTTAFLAIFLVAQLFILLAALLLPYT